MAAAKATKAFLQRQRQTEAFYTAVISESDGITDEPELANMNQVIGEGVIFTSWCLLRMTADGKVDPEDVVTVKAYLIWMVFSSTIRFYSLKAEFDISRYTLVPKGTLHHNASQPKHLGQYLTSLLKKKKLRTP